MNNVPGFAQLGSAQRENIASLLQPLRYPLGRTILIHQSLPTHLYIVYNCVLKYPWIVGAVREPPVQDVSVTIKMK